MCVSNISDSGVFRIESLFICHPRAKSRRECIRREKKKEKNKRRKEEKSVAKHAYDIMVEKSLNHTSAVRGDEHLSQQTSEKD
jgi:hypothetical protein